MIGWIICVEDFVANDKATKLIKGGREKAEEKRESLQEKYESIQKDRFRVGISAPVNEINQENRITARFSLPDEFGADQLLRTISEVDPFLLNEQERIVELDKSLVDDLSHAVAVFNEFSEQGQISFELL